MSTLDEIRERDRLRDIPAGITFVRDQDDRRELLRRLDLALGAMQIVAKACRIYDGTPEFDKIAFVLTDARREIEA